MSASIRIKHDADAGKNTRVKAFESFQIKDEATGEVEAIIATLNVVDKDREVITPEAVTWQTQKAKMSSYGHDIVGGFLSGGALPVGKGLVTVEKNKVVFNGKMFSTERAKETLAVLKELGPDCEWSFGFRVLGSEVPDEEWSKKGAVLILTKLDIFEVSPVLIGAGVGTRTVAAKCDGCGGAAGALACGCAEKKAAEDAAKKLTDEQAAAETKRIADEVMAKAARETAEQQARVFGAMEEYNRIQRALKRMGYA